MLARAIPNFFNVSKKFIHVEVSSLGELIVVFFPLYGQGRNDEEVIASC